MSEKPVAVVTGVTGGMGREIAHELTRTHVVIGVGRNAERLDRVAAETGCEGWQYDVTDPALTEKISQLPRIDVLVNAAAIAHARTVESAEAEEWDTHFAINVTAQAMVTRAALPQLRDSHGTVIFVGSGASTRPAPANVIYTATKHALKAVADVLRIDEEPHRIRVSTIAPGQTDTEMLRGLVGDRPYDEERYIRPASVARAVRFVVDAPDDAHITDLAVRPRQEVARI